MSVLKKSTALFLSIVIVICSMLMNIGTVLAAERNESSSVLDDDEINDFSVPELNVTVDDENKWTNDINKLKITAPVSTEIYYKTSTDKLDDWGNYTDSDAFVWDGDESENLPQGSYYIKFWAKYPGESNPVNDSVEAVHFMYDTEGPSAFKIKETKITNSFVLTADVNICFEREKSITKAFQLQKIIARVFLEHSIFYKKRFYYRAYIPKLLRSVSNLI